MNVRGRRFIVDLSGVARLLLARATGKKGRFAGGAAVRMSNGCTSVSHCKLLS
jgi:hypothetical protein